MNTNNGLEIFKTACEELDFSPIDLIVKTARWVDPLTYNALPVWYPEKARKMPMYQKDWATPQLNNKKPKSEANESANKALKRALGLSGCTNWTVCHIWGFDDPKFQTKSKIVQDPKYYSNIGNMVLLPTPVKAFTDSLDDVKTMLKICSYNLYGFICEGEESAEKIKNDPLPLNYPKEWPTPDKKIPPPGLIEFNPLVQGKYIEARKSQIRQYLRNLNFQRIEGLKEQVLSVLKYFPCDETNWWEK